MNFNVNTKAPVVLTSALIVAMSSMGALSFLDFNNQVDDLVTKKNEVSYRNVLANAAVKNNTDFIYLSDIDYMDISYTAYKTIQKDQNLDGGQLSLIVNGQKRTFLKGILAHANATLAYDLRDYDYDYLTAYLGVDAAQGDKGSLRFEVHTSEDGKNWTRTDRVNNNFVFKGNTEAYFLKYPIKGVKFIKFVMQDNGGNANDHSVLANAKLIKEGYIEGAPIVDFIKPVAEYDSLIRSFNSETLTREQELILLQRNFVNNVGYDLLNDLISLDADAKEAIEYLMTDLDNLKLYTMGGAPAGSYYNSIKVFTRLYKAYHNDWSDPTISRYGNVKGLVYKKMAFALALTHSTRVSLWMQPTHALNQSDAVTRYSLFKKMYDEDMFVVTKSLDVTKWFENYEVEEMRYVMNNMLDDESILWLHDYTQAQIEAHPSQAGSYLTPHPYMAYVWPNYGNAVFHDPARKDYWDAKFMGIFSKYGVSYSTSSNKVQKVWMNFRNEFGTGAVCGGISKTGHNIRGVHGIPSAVIGQPGHAAIVYYQQTANGDGYWSIDNDVSGWTLSEKGERMPLGWGNNKKFASGYNVPYMIMAQEAINRFDQYQQSAEYLILANTYGNDLSKKEEYLWKSIDALDFNVDTWFALINLYKQDATKTEEDYYNLASRMSEALLEYPLAFHDLMKQIAPKLTSNAYKFKYQLLFTDTLTKGKNYKGTDVQQPGVVRTMASYLLGKIDNTLAKFSFDGANAEEIILSNRFDGNGIRWDYSLDGKQTWHEVSFTGEEAHKLKLTKEEIASITSTNDIYIHIVGVNYSEENLYKIDILESAGLPSTLYANDNENKMIATIPTLMWKLNENDEWTYYKDAIPDLSGDKDVIIKAGATGVYLSSKTETTYHFTANTDPNTRKYISIDHLSLASVSSEATAQGRYARNTIDGNIKTSWHSNWNGADRVKEIVIKFDEPKNLTALEYIPAAGGNGKIESAQILVSMDGTNWTEVVSGTNWTYANTNDVSMKSVDFEPAKGQYIKIVGKKTQAASSSLSFMTGAMFNFYENTEVQIKGTFAFDGENAGKIVLDKESYNGGSWKYSIDAGETWIDGLGDAHQLTANEIESINESDGIKLLFAGDPKEYSINIKTAAMPARATYLNDLENRLIGQSNIDKLEWKIKGQGKWTSYSEAEPVVKGERTLLVRTKAYGIYQASTPQEYEFTADGQDKRFKYVPVNHLSIAEYSSQSVDTGRPFYAPNAIDGNPDTLWHTDFRYNVITQGVKPYLTVKLDEARYISALEFIQKKYKVNDPDYIKNATVYVSADGENWIPAGTIENCPQNVEMRRIEFPESVYGQYVKLEMETYNMFASIAMMNIYEDDSKEPDDLPNVEIEYSTKELTNQDVIATIVSDDDITITNNDGSNTYTFTENGNFKFEYEDEDGNVGEIVAIVDWIDKAIPTGTITYSTKDITNDDVIVTLNPNEEVTITNNDGLNTYTFTENGEFTFEYVDKAGNIGSTTVAVDWINKSAPVGQVVYSKSTLTNESVVATLQVANGITVTNNNGEKIYTFAENGSFTFEFRDSVGNIGTATATVNWIDKTAPIGTIAYSTKEITNKNVIATLVSNEEVTILNNNGKNTYTFEENGTFTFEFADKAGNIGKAIATVNNIDKAVPTVKLEYSNKDLTNQDVVVTLTSDKEITILNNNGKNTYTFTENGEFTFKFQDKAGNIGEATARVSNIDKVAPTAEIEYSTKELTNQDVVVKLINISEDVTILSNDGNATYTFTENGVFEFVIQDKAGNISKYTATVNNIFKNAPVASVSYSTKDLTNQDVVATIICDEEITIENNDGKTTYTFEENGTFTFIYRDKAGNVGKVVAVVDWIDKTAPIAYVSYSTEEDTTEDVVVTISSDEEIIITNNEGKNTYTFTENGEFTFEYEDKLGNKGSITIYVDWIIKDSEGPTEPTTPVDPVDPTEPTTPTEPTEPTEPTLPSEPTEPNEPDLPSEPVTPSNPVIPSEPNISDKPNNNKPSTNINNKPQNSNNTTTTEPTTTNNIQPTKPTTNSSNTGEKESSSSFATNGVSVDIVMDKESYSLKKNSLALNDSLKDKVGSESEYFELYLEDATNNKNYVDSKETKITIDIDSHKKLQKVYQVSDNGDLTELQYETTNNNQIKVSSKGLGKYILSYEEEIEIPMTKEAKKNKKLLWYVIGTGVVIISGAAGTAYYKRKED